MHELALGNSIINQAAEQLRAGEVELARVKTLRIAVGDLSGTDAHTLSLIMNEIISSSELPNAMVDVERIPAKVLCSKCGEVEAAAPFRLICPQCGLKPNSISGGEEITIKSVEVDDG